MCSGKQKCIDKCLLNLRTEDVRTTKRITRPSMGIKEFVTFLRYVEKNIHDLARSMQSACTCTANGNEIISLIENFLSSIVSDKDVRRGLDFVSAQVAYDINESVNLFGDADSSCGDDILRIVLGYGGEQGASILNSDVWDSVEDFLDDTEVQRDCLRGLEISGASEEDMSEMESIIHEQETAQDQGIRTINGKRRRSHSGHGNIEGSRSNKRTRSTRSDRWKYFMRELLLMIRAGNESLLQIFGLKRASNGDVLVAYNQRLLSMIDIEHMCCKLYLALSRCCGTRAYNKPCPSRPHCPPTRSKDLQPVSMSDIMKQCIAAYEEMVRENKWPTLSKAFKMAGEN